MGGLEDDRIPYRCVNRCKRHGQELMLICAFDALICGTFPSMVQKGYTLFCIPIIIVYSDMHATQYPILQSTLRLF
jgi:hypothetical protein